MKGSTEAGQPGVYMIRNLQNPLKTPGAREGAAAWSDGTGTLWLFGGFGLDRNGAQGRLADLWRYDESTNNWVWIAGPNIIDTWTLPGIPGETMSNARPGARDGAVSWMDADGRLWLHGGYGIDASGNPGYLNDLWLYDPGADQWALEGGSTSAWPIGFYGAQGVPSASASPGGRAGAVGWMDMDGGLWLFGGFGRDANGAFGNLNDIWRYDPGDGQWTWMNGAMTRNSPGLYGAIGVPDPMHSPSGREMAVSWVDAMGHLWMMGGYGVDSDLSLGYLNDLWRYEPGANAWAWVSGSEARNQAGLHGTLGEGGPDTVPGARDGAVGWADEEGIWLFGGFGRDGAGAYGRLNDLWRYEIASGVWTWIGGSAGNGEPGSYGTECVPCFDVRPGARSRASAFAGANGSLWLFGGHGWDGQGALGRLNDLWRYRVEPIYTLIYIAGENGTIEGDSPQFVLAGNDGSFVEAVPDECFEFIQWDDGSTENPRQDTNVQTDITVTAIFGVTQPPTLVCVGSATVELDEDGYGAIELDDLVLEAADACGGEVGLSTIGGSTQFDCEDAGTILTIAVLAVDQYGNSATCEVAVSVVDLIPPTLSCAESFTLELGPDGLAFLAPEDLAEAFDNCGVEEVWLDRYEFGCADLETPVTVVVTAADASGNTATCAVPVTVVDNNPLVLACAQVVVVELDEEGFGAVSAADLVLEASAVCDADPSIEVQGPTEFGCMDIGGEASVLVTATDASGNTATCVVAIMVVDTLPPVLECATSVVVELDALGVGSIDLDEIASATDNCGVASLQASREEFTCADIGDPVMVTIVALDDTGNSAICVVMATVVDLVPPTLSCVQSITVELGPDGLAFLAPEDIAEASDNCSVAEVWLDRDQFTCADIGEEVVVVVTAMDTSGNTSECAVPVVVVDLVPPTLACAEEAVVELGPNGLGYLEPWELVEAFDNCESLDLEVSQGVFGCMDVGEEVQVVVTATDASGNTATCVVMVSVVDLLPPTLQCASSIVVELDAQGLAVPSLPVAASDNCGIEVLGWAPDEFSCADIGDPVMVTVTAIDTSGNSATCVVMATVVDLIPPTLSCVQSITVELGPDGVGFLAPEDVAQASDNCGVAEVWIDRDQFTCDDIGEEVVVVVTAMDTSGNTSECAVPVVVLNSNPPGLSCVTTLVVELGPDGTGTIAAEDLVLEAAGACGEQLSLEIVGSSTFGCADAGSIEQVMLVASDGQGNTATCVVEVSVVDLLPPTLECQPAVIVELDAQGVGSIDLAAVASASDNCGILEVFAGVQQFTCADIGQPIPFTITAIDTSGNSAACVVMVTVVDTVPPTLSCVESVVVELDTAGIGFLDIEDLLLSAEDNCALESVELLGQTEFGCGDIPNSPIEVLLLATDASGNTATCAVLVEVASFEPPAVVCPPDFSLPCEPGGVLFEFVPEVVGGCGIVAVIIVPDPNVEPLDAGTTEIEVTVVDTGGQTATCSFFVTIIGDEAPPRTLVSDPLRDGGLIESELPGMEGMGGSFDIDNQAVFIGDNARNRQEKALFSFDTSSLPGPEFIQGAFLRLTLLNARGAVRPADGAFPLGHLVVDIGPVFGEPALEASDFEAPAAVANAAYPPFIPPSLGSSIFIELTPSGIGNIDADGTTQFRVAFEIPTNGNNSTDGITVSTARFGVDSPYVPELIVLLTSGTCAGPDCGFVQPPPTGGPTRTVVLPSIAALDGHVLEFAEDATVGATVASSSGQIIIGDDAINRQYKGFVAFNTSFLSPDDVILEAELELVRASMRGNPVGMMMPLGSELLVDMTCPDPGFFGSANALEPRDFESFADLPGFMALNVPMANLGKATGQLPMNAILAINRDGTTHFRIAFPEATNRNNSADYIGFFAGEERVFDRKPKLRLVIED